MPKAGIIFNLSGRRQLPAGLDAFNDEGPKVGPRGIDRRRQSSGSGADDDHISHVKNLA